MASTAGQRRAKQRENAERGPSLTVVLDDQVYTWTAKDMTALDVRALREQTGMSYQGLIKVARTDMDIDLVAAVVWMARRIGGERALSFAEVAAGINWASEYFITDDPNHKRILATRGDEEDGQDPEA